jgi:hypothetical protein
MSAFPFNLFSPFSQTVGRFLYDPTTNWQGAFSPSIVFNANPQDAPLEANVLSKVGSYGKQLGVLIRVIDLLQSRLDPSSLDPDETAAIKAFEDLRDGATAAAEAFRSQVSASDIVELAKAYRAHQSPYAVQSLRESLDAALKP